MNVIVILIDSLNRHHLTAYGSSAVAMLCGRRLRGSA
jgi:hypothetical protein